MVGVVQLVERQVVILNVAGSSPVTHPIGRRVCFSPSDLFFLWAPRILGQDCPRWKSDRGVERPASATAPGAINVVHRTIVDNSAIRIRGAGRGLRDRIHTDRSGPGHHIRCRRPADMAAAGRSGIDSHERRRTPADTHCDAYRATSCPDRDKTPSATPHRGDRLDPTPNTHHALALPACHCSHGMFQSPSPSVPDSGGPTVWTTSTMSPRLVWS
jgi:hypothetical protein